MKEIFLHLTVKPVEEMKRDEVLGRETKTKTTK